MVNVVNLILELFHKIKDKFYHALKHSHYCIFCFKNKNNYQKCAILGSCAHPQSVNSMSFEFVLNE